MRPRFALLSLVLLLPLAACGFHPLYADEPVFGYDPDLAAIDVHPVPDRIGQLLTSSLKEQLNPRGIALQKLYELNIALSFGRTDLGIRRDNTSTRGELVIYANLSLSDKGKHSEIYHENLRTVTSFNLPDDAYAALVAEQKARQEAAQQMGVEIAERLSLYVRQRRTGAAE
jgi:LPS-assembly lipoprotein